MGRMPGERQEEMSGLIYGLLRLTCIAKTAGMVLVPVRASRQLMNLPDDLGTKVNMEFYPDARPQCYKCLE